MDKLQAAFYVVGIVAACAAAIVNIASVVDRARKLPPGWHHVPVTLAITVAPAVLSAAAVVCI